LQRLRKEHRSRSLHRERLASTWRIERGWLWMHESRTYVKFTQAGADLFA
jgi:hypothetical protein